MTESENHFVYIVECRDGTFYTGYTTDVTRRVAMHNANSGAKYTRGRTPVRLLHVETFEDKGQALRREQAIKGLTKSAKRRLIELVQSKNPRNHL